jgi:hypothetical protein
MSDLFPYVSEAQKVEISMRRNYSMISGGDRHPSIGS